MADVSVGEILREAGAIKKGHFLLSSGLHSDTYIEKFDLLRQPRLTEGVCTGFVRAFVAARVDVVVGPTTGGILLAFETARQMNVMAAYAERVEDESEERTGRAIRRGTVFRPGTRVLVVDDILTTGGSVRETLTALTPHPVTVVGVGVIMDRSTQDVDFGVPLTALYKEPVAVYRPEDCPLCAAGIPLVKPGSTAQPGPR